MLTLFVFLFLLLSKLTFTSDVKVLELTADVFENHTTRPEGVTVVMFYAPWCPHCQDAKPEIFKAAAKITKSDSKNYFAFLNCDTPANTELCQKENIEGYPTIKAYSPDKKTHLFAGTATEESLMKFIENPTEVSEQSDANFDEEHHPDVPLNHTKYLNKDNFKATLSSVKHALVFFYAPWCSHCQESKPGVDKASEKLKSKDHEIFAINCEDKNSKSICAEQNLEGYPTIKYFHNGEMFAEYEDELSPEMYLKYLSKPPKEKVKETHKENVEDDKIEDQKMEFAISLTGKTFTEETKLPGHHTMVMFYTPSCPHCQSAKPIYDSAAKTIHKENSNHVLAAVNCSEKLNEDLCEEEKIDGFPTFVHYVDGKRVKIYEDVPINADKLIKYFSSLVKDEL